MLNVQVGSGLVILGWWAVMQLLFSLGKEQKELPEGQSPNHCHTVVHISLEQS